MFSIHSNARAREADHSFELPPLERGVAAVGIVPAARDKSERASIKSMCKISESMSNEG